MTGSQRQRRRARSRRTWIVIGAGLVAIAALGVAVGLALTRYLPALDEARVVRADLERVLDRTRDAGLAMDRATLTAIQQDFASLVVRFDRLDDLLAGDPLVGLAGALPPTRDAVAGTRAVTAAGREVLVAAEAGLGLVGRYVTIREQQGSAGAPVAGEGTAVARLVELMATGRGDVDRIVAAIDRADVALAAAPRDLPGPIAQMRDVLAKRLQDYAPLLHGYAKLDDTLPGILGWDGPKRYLVLTQNPAELRPTGGFIGSFGTITFDRGRITERKFQDVFLLDLPWTEYPFVAPPPELARYLLGPTQPWQLADANWSPDFPTSARDAIRLYRNEGGTGAIDGVLGITTYTIDELLTITGPVTVPTYDVTVASGETTLKTLQNTRPTGDPATDRKAFLSAFADRLFESLLALPTDQWTRLAGKAEQFQAQKLLQAWFTDDLAQHAITELGIDGSIRRDAGDFIFPVDSNVSPVSKLNAVTDRDVEVNVRLDDLGNASNELTVRWTNRIESAEARPYRELPTLERNKTLGMYFRLYLPERSRLESVIAGTEAPITSAADVADDAGRQVISNYFRIPAGSARLTYHWISPYPAELGDDGLMTYRLTIQKQPGLRAGPLRARIMLPGGASIVEASPGLRVDGAVASVETLFDRDVVIVVRYRPAQEAPG